MKQFVAVTTETINNKLALIQTSASVSLFNESGIDFESAIEFLFDLIYKRENRKQKTVFVSYGFSRDCEFIFATAPKDIKDKVFQSFNIRREVDRIDFENEQLDEILFNPRIEKDTWTFAETDFQKYVNILSRQELTEVKIKDFYISLATGKRLTIRRRGKSISIYDIYGFFKNDSLQTSCEKYGVKCLERVDFSDFPFSYDRYIKFLAVNECQSISKLAEKLESELNKIGINLSRYHGATAVSSAILTKSKAKTEYHAYRYKRQLSKELDKACYQSYYGGRVEQLKLGTLENVKIYDINSAYAYACSFLPVLLSKPVFTKTFDGSEKPFAIYYIEYDLNKLLLYYGFLPNRDNNNSTKYKLKGAGYFWFPEVEFLLRHYPNCIEIKKGFFWDYEKANFTETIREFYSLRCELKQQGKPLEKVLKKALQGIYGKFFQHQGKGHFFNPFYAGFICSFVRRLLLDATKGFERETICFLTDAIHTTANLPLELSDSLGAFRLESYDKVTYLDSGVYQCYRNGEIVKTKHKGSKNFDFENALLLMNKTGYYKADNSIFIGHNVFSMNQFSNAEYLSIHNLDKAMMPQEFASRIFESKKINFANEYLDSKPTSFFGGRESLPYRMSDFSENDYSLDTINARKL